MGSVTKSNDFRGALMVLARGFEVKGSSGAGSGNIVPSVVRCTDGAFKEPRRLHDAFEITTGVQNHEGRVTG